ncbi:type II toxin-antitoxin system HicA family toxin [Dyadobacter arcticus]|uniref:RNA binding protein YcfA (HicA-like mRNA interferase family) n=1 Tax=Dyadobacter arcticus TaxID=1078754 RepID=A0ABX0URP9_9BACT|nr:type II toxin-antitoxin system HicA family toxin [Dyadobacter arcticus]NIJ55497.1 putative RNA binding protein YcfA (HicA-like mRNA interferase family) [Dyadobacter arcticus]
MTARQLLEILKEDGWYLKSQNGTSHQQYIHPEKRGKITVSYKGKDEIPRGTLNGILKQAGLK